VEEIPSFTVPPAAIVNVPAVVLPTMNPPVVIVQVEPVPVTVAVPPAFMVVPAPLVSVPPFWIVSMPPPTPALPAVAAWGPFTPISVGFGIAVLMLTFPVVGTMPVDQLPAVNQSEEIVPVHVCARAGIAASKAAIPVVANKGVRIARPPFL
jgi:hypothetical protein